MGERKWECVAAEFGDNENAGLVAFWVRMDNPSLCKRDANLIEAAHDLYEALRNADAVIVSLDAYNKYGPVKRQMAAALAKAGER